MLSRAEARSCLADESVHDAFGAGFFEIDQQLVAFHRHDAAIAEFLMEHAFADGIGRRPRIGGGDGFGPRFDDGRSGTRARFLGAAPAWAGIGAVERGRSAKSGTRLVIAESGAPVIAVEPFARDIVDMGFR